MRKFILLIALIAIANCETNSSSTGEINNLLNCALSVKGVVDEVKNFANMLNSTKDSQELVYEYTIFAGKVMGALRDCNIKTSIRIMPASPEACINDAKNIFRLVQKLLAEKDSKNYPAIIEDLIALIQDIQQAIPDCTGKKITLTNINLTQCAMDGQKTGKDLMTIYEDLKDGTVNYTLFLNMSLSIMRELPDSLEHCGFPEYANEFGDLTKSLGTNQCQNDITSSIVFLEKAEKAYKEQDYVKLIHESSGLFMKGKLIAKECLNLNVGFFLNRALDLAKKLHSKDITPIQARQRAFLLLRAYDNLKLSQPKSLRFQQKAQTAGCAASVLALIPEAEVLLKDYESGSYAQFIGQMPVIAKLLGNLIAECK